MLARTVDFPYFATSSGTICSEGRETRMVFASADISLVGEFLEAKSLDSVPCFPVAGVKITSRV